MRHFIEGEISRFKGTGFFVDDELDSGLYRNILVRAVAGEFDDVLMIIAFKILPLWIGEEVGKGLFVSSVGIFVWMTVLDHLNIAVFSMLRIAQRVFNIFNVAQHEREEKGEPVFVFMQAFRDAGQAFEVIDSYTESVLVPYAEGKELIAAFDKRVGDKKLFYQDMRRAQQYMVNLFRHEMETLEAQGAVRQTESGVFALHEPYYRDDFGVQLAQETTYYMM